MSELPEGAQRTALGPQETLRVFRIVRVPEVSDPRLIDDLCANAERGRRARRLEVRYPLLHSGVSVYEQREDAKRVAQMFPRLGGWLAEVDLRVDDVVSFARWGHGSHLTVWAPPQVLLDAVVSLSPVRE